MEMETNRVIYPLESRVALDPSQTEIISFPQRTSGISNQFLLSGYSLGQGSILSLLSSRVKGSIEGLLPLLFEVIRM